MSVFLWIHLWDNYFPAHHMNRTGLPTVLPLKSGQLKHTPFLLVQYAAFQFDKEWKILHLKISNELLEQFSIFFCRLRDHNKYQYSNEQNRYQTHRLSLLLGISKFILCLAFVETVKEGFQVILIMIVILSDYYELKGDKQLVDISDFDCSQSQLKH